MLMLPEPLKDYQGFSEFRQKRTRYSINKGMAEESLKTMMGW